MRLILKSLSYSVISFVFLLSFNINAQHISAQEVAQAIPSKPTAKPWLLKTQTGEVISLEQYKNKPVILHFWATWCPYCKKIQPTLVELQKKYQEEGVELVAISFNEDDDALPQNEINRRGFSFITAIKGEKVAQLYGVRGTPTTFFINRNNEIIYKTSSSNKEDPRFDLALKAITAK